LYPSSEFSLIFLNISSHNGFAGLSPAGQARTKPLVAMTAHASRPSVPQTVTTPSEGHLRPADFGSTRVSAASLGPEEKVKGRTACAQS
jgi:hypothetical protein